MRVRAHISRFSNIFVVSAWIQWLRGRLMCWQILIRIVLWHEGRSHRLNWSVHAQNLSWIDRADKRLQLTQAWSLWEESIRLRRWLHCCLWHDNRLRRHAEVPWLHLRLVKSLVLVARESWCSLFHRLWAKDWASVFSGNLHRFRGHGLIEILRVLLILQFRGYLKALSTVLRAVSLARRDRGSDHSLKKYIFEGWWNLPLIYWGPLLDSSRELVKKFRVILNKWAWFICFKLGVHLDELF